MSLAIKKDKTYTYNIRDLISLYLLLLLLLSGCFDNKAKKELKKKGFAYTTTTFINSAATGNIEIMKLFIQAGIDVNATDSLGKTALWEAKKNDQTECAEILLITGASYKASLPYIVKNLENQDTKVRKKAFNVIRELGSDATIAVNVLEKIGKNSSNISELTTIIEVLESINTEPAINTAVLYKEKVSQLQIKYEQKRTLEKEMYELANKLNTLARQEKYALRTMNYGTLSSSSPSATIIKFRMQNLRAIQNQINQIKNKLHIKTVEYESNFGRNELLSFFRESRIGEYISY